MRPEALQGLYAITSQAICAEQGRLLRAVSAALEGGAALIQYRDKWNEPRLRAQYARQLLQLCRSYGVPLIINDDVQLAAAIQADGVHLGAADASLADARAALGEQTIIGVTCANSMERAHRAATGGADYLALGRFYPSRTKPDAPQATLELLSQVHRALPLIPICAIGGVTPHNAATLLERGATMLAAVESVFGAEDIAAAAAQFKVSYPHHR